MFIIYTYEDLSKMPMIYGYLFLQTTTINKIDLIGNQFRIEIPVTMLAADGRWQSIT